MLIADFAVDSSAVKPETKRDPDLQSWIAAFERDRSFKLSLLGLDDCVGSPAKREQLRRERARSVRDLFGPDAKAACRGRGCGARTSTRTATRIPGAAP